MNGFEWRRVAAVVLLGGGLGTGVVALTPPPTDACGPEFPNQVLWSPDKMVLSSPVAVLDKELPKGPAKLGNKPKKAPKIVFTADPKKTTRQVEVADLTAALRAQGAGEGTLRAQLATLSTARQRMDESLPINELVVKLPEEFRLYLRGASEHYAGRGDEAKKEWQALLALPEAKRRWRATWAAWMLARTAKNWSEAVRYYELVRTLQAAGAEDSLGLVASSLGWQARLYLDRGAHAKAVALYAQQARMGEPSAASSLEMVIRPALKKPSVVAALASDPVAAHAVSAWFASRPSFLSSPDDDAPLRKAWLQACAKVGTKHAESAKLLGWNAYREGRYDEADKWLKMAPQRAPITKWLQAKLALYKGDVKRGMALLRAAAKGFPQLASSDTERSSWSSGSRWPSYVDHRGEVLAQAGAVALSRRDYAEAARLLFVAGWWDDAAYVAEKVLTLPELQKLVDRHAKPLKGAAAKLQPWERPGPPVESLRALLGRRLVRAGKLSQALRYLGKAEIPLVKQAIALRKASTRGAPRARAAALWKLAKLTRRWGMEMMGTEVGPDWTVWSGSFETSSNVDTRAKLLAKGGAKFGPDQDELKRAAQAQVKPNKRFHYRYIAAGLGWQAAALLPDDTKLKAGILCEAGSWLKWRDPMAADRYYKAMVRKNPTVDLAVAADGLRWFPHGCKAPKF